MDNKTSLPRRPSLRLRLVSLCLFTILVVLVLSVGSLLLLINNVMGTYVRSNIEFALKETGSNLSVKTAVLEDMLLRLRDNTVLQAALSADGLVPADTEDSPTLAALNAEADLYAHRNIDSIDVPFVDMVFLFDKNGVCNRTAYTEHLLARQAEIDQVYADLWYDFTLGGTDTAIVSSDTHINILYTLYNEWMEPLGTVIFAVNQDAVRQLMAGAEKYPGAFWAITDKQGKSVLQSDTMTLSAEDLRTLALTRRDSAALGSVNGTEQLLFTQALRMGLRCCIGVPQNQLSLLLYDAVLPYVFVTIALLLCVAAVLFGVVLRETKPLSDIAGKLKQVADKDFDVKLPAYEPREYATIASAFNTMTDTIKHLISDVYEKKLLAMDSEIQMLQSQINPHFMYNVLHTIALKAQMDGNAEVHQMIRNFAGLTRARLSHKGNEKISLEQELQYVQFYLELQKVRFEDKLQAHVCVQDPALLQTMLPRLTLEMIVENAVVHGIEPKDGPGNVYIDISQSGADVLILVEDDGVGFAQQDGIVPLPLAPPPSGQTETTQKTNHIALNTAYKLMRHFYGPQYGITIRSRRGVGTVVEILLPAQEGAEHD